VFLFIDELSKAKAKWKDKHYEFVLPVEGA
jgi:hypothetical protein